MGAIKRPSPPPPPPANKPSSFLPSPPVFSLKQPDGTKAPDGGRPRLPKTARFNIPIYPIHPEPVRPEATHPEVVHPGIHRRQLPNTQEINLGITYDGRLEGIDEMLQTLDESFRAEPEPASPSISTTLATSTIPTSTINAPTFTAVIGTAAAAITNQVLLDSATAAAKYHPSQKSNQYDLALRDTVLIIAFIVIGVALGWAMVNCTFRATDRRTRYDRRRCGRTLAQPTPRSNWKIIPANTTDEEAAAATERNLTGGPRPTRPPAVAARNTPFRKLMHMARTGNSNSRSSSSPRLTAVPRNNSTGMLATDIALDEKCDDGKGGHWRTSAEGTGEVYDGRLPSTAIGRVLV